MEHGVKTLEVEVKGRVSGASPRCAPCRRGFHDHRIRDVTPIPHNGAARRSVGAF